jgi:hypothetical protein
MSLSPPSENEEYPTRSAMISAIQAHAAQNGYAVTIRSSNYIFNIVYLGCDRSGLYKARNGLNETNRQRDTSSRLTGCLFSVKGSLKNGVWIVKVRVAEHNHEASPAIAHPILRRAPYEVMSEVTAQSNSGTKAQNIITSLRQTTEHPVLAQDVYNMRKKVKAINLDGKTPMESLISVLKDFNYAIDYLTDHIGRVTHLFFAHPASIKLLNQFPEVLLLDCTYKTNKFKMPLLNIVGTTCLNTSFYVAFCFLTSEEEDSYVWALERLKILFRNSLKVDVLVMDRELALINAARSVFSGARRILCVWHVDKNILVHAIQEINTKDVREEFIKHWANLISSTTRTTYEINWNTFQDRYDRSYPALVQYVQNTWLRPFRDNLVRAWIDRHPYFGNRATSRVEGAHSILKSYLQVSTGDLRSVYDKITLLLKNQHIEFNAAVAHN